MKNNNLKNKPLVEATMELRWKLKEGEGEDQASDPHYKLLLSRFFDRISGENGPYPNYVELPSAKLPEEYVAHVVQHRFFSGENQPPLVQLGPGVLTLHSTKDNYTWGDFKDRITFVTQKLYESYPNPNELQLESLSIRYINALDFDYLEEDITDFIQENLKINVKYPDALFENHKIRKIPTDLNLVSSFESIDPAGVIQFRIGSGKVNKEVRVLLWDVDFESNELDMVFSDQFDYWLEEVHSIIEDWFFKLIKGNLERRFN
jgi:uncharacterized protein (TIGR04255 family)